MDLPILIPNRGLQLEGIETRMTVPAGLKNIDDLIERIRQLVEASDNAPTQSVRQARQEVT
jgi:hypothetical protein